MSEPLNPRYDTIEIGRATVAAIVITAVSEFGLPSSAQCVVQLVSGEEKLGTRPYADVVADWQAHLTRCRLWESRSARG